MSDDSIGIGSGSLLPGISDGDGNGPDLSAPQTLHDPMLVDLGIANPAGSVAYAILKEDFLLGLELSALEDVGKAEIVSQPKVVTGDKQEASIRSGVEIPYLEATSSGAASVTFKEAVLLLNVTPQITPDDNIIMNLNIDQNSVGELFTNVITGAQIPAINVNSLQTKVLVANGETIVLGGIFEAQAIEGEVKVPVLGDIPFLGHLFKTTTKQEDKRELLIFITPRIMQDEFMSFSK